METRQYDAKLPIWAGVAATLAIGLFVVADTAFAGGPAPVGLGTAAPFAVLAGTHAAMNVGATTITGDLGTSREAAVAGFPRDAAAGSWPLFLAMIGLVLGLAMFVAAHWRAEEM
jgi:hypothetical protein